MLIVLIMIMCINQPALIYWGEAKERDSLLQAELRHCRTLLGRQAER